ncbi:MAG: hypothetical protein JW993_15240 [Sedimentisphaerales bacterium]|nr:hypothetical protein [Sedimentisphaerales bacterium]
MTRKNVGQMRMFLCLIVLTCMALLWPDSARGQRRRGRAAQGPPTLGLDQGLIELDTPEFNLKLVKASQTVAALAPKGANGFDFTPADQLENRAADGFHHLGDLTLRLRLGDAGPWQTLSTAAARKPVTALEVSSPTLAAADLTPTLPSDCPLQITRSWMLDDGKLVLKFDLKNKTDQTVQIGALGIPMIFNNIITRRSLEQAHETCSFFDPYIGRDAGYLQVTRLSGHGPALVVVPEAKTPFEGYQLLNEPMRPTQTFEGAFEWLAHSQAYAENEWDEVEPWNAPTMTTIAPGQTRTYGVKLLVSREICQIEDTLAANERPVAVGIPGYILPMDLDGKLFLNYPSQVASVAVSPEGAIEIAKTTPTKNSWQAYELHGKKWGRARLTVTYADGLEQSIHYYVIKPAAQAVADMGRFLTTQQWFVDPNDPFDRSPSVMSYDREADRIVTQDSRVWIAGLGDEGGSGSYVAAAMKEFGQPDKGELEKFERFVNETLWGGIQYTEGLLMYGVRKSMFYYGMPGFEYDSSLNWGSWTSWNKEGAESIGRAYNYPHVAATYWAMYRLARNNVGLVTSHPWDWYLDRAYQTVRFLTGRNEQGRYNVGYINMGLMEGTVFVRILEDLKREGWEEKAADFEARMKQRTEGWIQQAYPFGSEMAWDSTGQEEVYAWCKYFGYDDKALVSLNSILGYMPTVPHWGYNGCARRYWDFLYGGKLSRYERQLHHYGSGLNAIPVMKEYRETPDDYYLLRVGYGGTMGALSNIDQEGFASVAFHSFPDTLRWDAYTGDYGPNFFGHTINTGTYIINHPEFGWQAFGGNVQTEGNTVRVQTLDSLRKRVYVAPLGLYLTLDAGAFEAVAIDTGSKTVHVGLASATQHTPLARLRIEQPTARAGVGNYRPGAILPRERGAFDIPLASATTWVELIPES